jgi:hypothetical protein
MMLVGFEFMKMKAVYFWAFKAGRESAVWTYKYILILVPAVKG